MTDRPTSRDASHLKMYFINAFIYSGAEEYDVNNLPDTPENQSKKKNC